VLAQKVKVACSHPAPHLQSWVSPSPLKVVSHPPTHLGGGGVKLCPQSHPHTSTMTPTPTPTVSTPTLAPTHTPHIWTRTHTPVPARRVEYLLIQIISYSVNRVAWQSHLHTISLLSLDIIRDHKRLNGQADHTSTVNHQTV
jgi:hypothetical protein